MRGRRARPFSATTKARRDAARGAPTLRAVAGYCAIGVACAIVACGERGVGARAPERVEQGARLYGDGSTTQRSDGDGEVTCPSPDEGCGGECFQCGNGPDAICCPEVGWECSPDSSAGGSGLHPDTSDLRCSRKPQPPSSSCDSGDECPSKQCQGGQCVCHDELQCEEDESCKSERCVKVQCKSNGDCKTGAPDGGTAGDGSAGRGLVCSTDNVCVSPLEPSPSPELSCAHGPREESAPWVAIAAVALAIAAQGRRRSDQNV